MFTWKEIREEKDQGSLMLSAIWFAGCRDLVCITYPVAIRIYAPEASVFSWFSSEFSGNCRETEAQKNKELCCMTTRCASDRHLPELPHLTLLNFLKQTCLPNSNPPLLSWGKTLITIEYKRCRRAS